MIFYVLSDYFLSVTISFRNFKRSLERFSSRINHRKAPIKTAEGQSWSSDEKRDALRFPACRQSQLADKVKNSDKNGNRYTETIKLRFM